MTLLIPPIQMKPLKTKAQLFEENKIKNFIASSQFENIQISQELIDANKEKVINDYKQEYHNG